MSILSITLSCGGFLFFGLLYLSIYVDRCYWRSQAMKLGHGERKVGRLMRSVGELREALERKDAEMAGLEHRCDALREELVRARTELAQVQNQATAGPSEPPRYVISSFRQRFCDGNFHKMTKAMIKQLATDGNGVLNYLASKLDRNCDAQSNAFLTRVARRHNLPLDGMSEKNIGDRLEAFFAKEPAFARELLLVEFGIEGFQVRPGMAL